MKLRNEPTRRADPKPVVATPRAENLTAGALRDMAANSVARIRHLKVEIRTDAIRAIRLQRLHGETEIAALENEIKAEHLRLQIYKRLMALWS